MTGEAWEPPVSETPRITATEWRWVAAVSALCLAATVAPLLYGLAITPTGKAFMWNNVLDDLDLYTYLAWMEQGRQGHLLFTDRFTTEPHPRALFVPLFLVGGWIASLTQLSLPITYHLMRLALGALVLVLIYRWIASHSDKIQTRRVAFLLVVTSSGLGWLLGFWNLRAVDQGVPESITFMTLYQSPLFSASLACMVVIFSAFPGPTGRIRSRALLVSALAGAVLCWVHPYDIVTVLAVGAAAVVATAVRRGAVRPSLAWLLAVLAGALPAALHHARVILTVPVFRNWSEMVRAPSPAPWEIALGYGFLLPLAALGARDAAPGARDRRLLPIVWIATVAVLVYLPFGFQRRLLHGVHLPICLLAAFGIERLRASSHSVFRALTRGRRLRQGILFAASLAILSLSNFFMIAENLIAYRAGKAPHHIRTEYFDAFRWLRENTRPDHAVLSSMATGSFIPGTAGNTVYVGHWGLTLLVHQKKAIVDAFFRDDRDDVGKETFLRQAGIRYVFVGEVERHLGRFTADGKTYLAPLYKNAVVSIYGVVP